MIIIKWVGISIGDCLPFPLLVVAVVLVEHRSDLGHDLVGQSGGGGLHGPGEPQYPWLDGVLCCRTAARGVECGWVGDNKFGYTAVQNNSCSR